MIGVLWENYIYFCHVCFAYLLFVYISKVLLAWLCAVRLSRFRVRLRLEFWWKLSPTLVCDCQHIIYLMKSCHSLYVLYFFFQMLTGKDLWIIGNVRSCIFNECLSCCERSDLGGKQLSLFGELVFGCPRWSSAGFSRASVVIETETLVPHYPDRTHSSHRLWSTGPINRKPLFEQ